MFGKPGGRESSADVHQLPPDFCQGKLGQGGGVVRLHHRQLLLDELESMPQGRPKEQVERAMRDRRSNQRFV